MARTPVQVVREHMETMETGDVAAIMADYAQDVVMVTSMGTGAGKEAVTGMFAGLLQANPGIVFSELGLWSEDDTVVVYWSAESETASMPRGVDTFIVRDGLIVRQTAWAEVVPK